MCSLTACPEITGGIIHRGTEDNDHYSQNNNNKITLGTQEYFNVVREMCKLERNWNPAAMGGDRQ